MPRGGCSCVPPCLCMCETGERQRGDDSAGREGCREVQERAREGGRGKEI